jgi:hypothetical protein
MADKAASRKAKFCCEIFIRLTIPQRCKGFRVQLQYTDKISLPEKFTQEWDLPPHKKATRKYPGHNKEKPSDRRRFNDSHPQPSED